MSRLSLGEAFVTVRYDLARLPSDLQTLRSSMRSTFASVSRNIRSSLNIASAVNVSMAQLHRMQSSIAVMMRDFNRMRSANFGGAVNGGAGNGFGFGGGRSNFSNFAGMRPSRQGVFSGVGSSVGAGHSGGAGGAGNGFLAGMAGGAAVGLALNAFSRVSAKLKEMVDDAWTFNARMETLNQSFEQMLGTATAARRVTASLADYANKTPFELGAVSKVATMLLSTKKIAEGQLIPTIKKIGDTASASADGFASFPRVARGLSQMLTKGRITAEEMLQLSEAGVPAWNHLADAMGKSQAEVQKLSSEGKLGADAVLKLIDQMGKAYEGLAAKQSKTWDGLVSTLRDNVTQATAKIVKPIFDLSKIKLGNLVDFFASKDASEWIDRLQAGAATVTKVFGALVNSDLVKVAASIGGIAVAVGGTIKAVGLLSTVSSAIFGGPFLVAVGAVTAGIFALKKQIELVLDGPHGRAIREAFDGMWNSVKNMTYSLRENFLKTWQKVSDIVTGVMKEFAASDFVRNAVDGLREMVSLIELFSADWDSAWELMEISAKSVFDNLQEYLTALFALASDNFALGMILAFKRIKTSKAVADFGHTFGHGMEKFANDTIGGGKPTNLGLELRKIFTDGIDVEFERERAKKMGFDVDKFVGESFQRQYDSESANDPLVKALRDDAKQRREDMERLGANIRDTNDPSKNPRVNELYDKLREAAAKANKQREDDEMVAKGKEQMAALADLGKSLADRVREEFKSLMGEQDADNKLPEKKHGKSIEFTTSENLYRNVAEALNAKKTDADKNTGTMVGQLDRLLKVFGAKGVANIPGAKDIAERVNKVVAPTKEALKDVAGPLWNAIAKPFGLPTIDDVHRPKVLDKKQRADAFPVGKWREKAEEAATWYEKLLDDMKGVKDNAQEIRDMLDKNLNKEQYDAEVKLREILDANLNGGGLSVDSSGVSITDEMAKVSEQMAKNYAKENSPEADNAWMQVDKDQLDVLRSIRDSVGRFPDYLGFE